MESTVPLKKAYLLHTYQVVLVLATLIGKKNLPAKSKRTIVIVKPKFFIDKKSVRHDSPIKDIKKSFYIF